MKSLFWFPYPFLIILKTDLMNSNHTQLIEWKNTSINALLSNLLPNSMWISFGFIGCLCTILTISTILKSKALRSRYYWNCFNIALANFICSAAMTLVGCKRISLVILNRDEIVIPQWCALDIGSLIFAATAAIFQNLCLAIDRFLAVFFPYFHANIFETHGFFLNWLMWFSCLIFTIGCNTFGLTEAYYVPFCSHAIVYKQTEHLIEQYTHFSIVCFTVLVNLTILLNRFFHRPIQPNSYAEYTEIRLSKRLTKVMMYAVITDVCLWLLVNQVIIVVAHSYSVSAEVKISPFVPVASYMVPSILNLIFYLCIDRRFRFSFIKMFGWGSQLPVIVVTAPVGNILN